jgi:hypothetical protein
VGRSGECALVYLIGLPDADPDPDPVLGPDPDPDPDPDPLYKCLASRWARSSSSRLGRGLLDIPTQLKDSIHSAGYRVSSSAALLCCSAALLCCHTDAILIERSGLWADVEQCKAEGSGAGELEASKLRSALSSSLTSL